VLAQGVALACALAAAPARAQTPRPSGVPFGPFERPGQTRPQLPPPEQAPPAFSLPPLPTPSEEAPELSQRPRIVVKKFRIDGSTVFTQAQLDAVAAPYVGRLLGAEELEQLRQALTRLYVDAGYPNSGAELPDQDVRGGIVEYRIVEGRLSEVEIEGNRWFRDGYLRSRILRGARVPLDVAQLEQQLQILQQDPRIRRVDAALLPGDRPGEARLRARFEEELPFFASFQTSNYDSPSIGEYRQQIDLAWENVTGWGDSVRWMGAWTKGLWDTEAGYELPFTPWDTTIGAWYRWGTSDVIENPFDELDIESRAQTIGLELRQPVYHTVRNRIDFALTAEHRESTTYLLHENFPFEEGTDDGRVTVSVLRLRQDWIYRDLHQVVAARSQLSIGLHVLGATNDGCVFDEAGICVEPTGSSQDVPDARFEAWLGQFQWVRRFDPWAVEAVFRTDLQLTTEPVFSLEQFSLGGHQSVRGYRENQLVRDNGIASSLEVRLPLFAEEAWQIELQLAPFVDLGNSWNTKRPEGSPRTLASVGVGLRAVFRHNLYGEIYWGHRLQSVHEPENGDLQDEGVQFSVVASF
jgi:hemolysin activation/secretion protein